MTDGDSSTFEADALTVVGGLQGATAFLCGGLWVEGVVPAAVPVVFALSGAVVVTLGRVEQSDRKAYVSETPDEDPRSDDEDMPDASVRPGKSVSQEDLQAIADEHDIDVMGVDQASDEDTDE